MHLLTPNFHTISNVSTVAHLSLYPKCNHLRQNWQCTCTLVHTNDLCHTSSIGPLPCALPGDAVLTVTSLLYTSLPRNLAWIILTLYNQICFTLILNYQMWTKSNSVSPKVDQAVGSPSSTINTQPKMVLLLGSRITIKGLLVDLIILRHMDVMCIKNISLKIPCAQ